ncbi:MAG: MoaD/ThiS family protein [Anaerolineae bacterium]
MMATVVVPSLMRDLTGGRAQVEVPGRTVRDLLEALERRYPGIEERLCEGDELASTIVVSVDGKLSRLGLFQPVGEKSVIRFLPAIEGG